MVRDFLSEFEQDEGDKGISDRVITDNVLEFSASRMRAVRVFDMSDEALRAVYLRVETEGLDRIVFYDGSMTGAAAFVDFARSEDVELRCLYHGEQLVAFVWLNNPLGLACMIHFCIFRSFWKHQRAIGLWTVRQFLEPVNPETGKAYLTALYGLTPKVFRHALGFIRSLGFRVLGEVPGACEFQGVGGVKFRSGVVSVVTLADIVQDGGDEVVLRDWAVVPVVDEVRVVQ